MVAKSVVQQHFSVTNRVVIFVTSFESHCAAIDYAQHVFVSKLAGG
jgi:hypothetical protein